ncbi:MAG: hypothetical protein AVO35_12035 [Candidatus Aegiribacteria sp. MLS_C]|nr:MAG: hypothetical protein AVO35_12035 [Candidatus Aegiribacteria sp. MLS_C]
MFELAFKTCNGPEWLGKPWSCREGLPVRASGVHSRGRASVVIAAQPDERRDMHPSRASA